MRHARCIWLVAIAVAAAAGYAGTKKLQEPGDACSIAVPADWQAKPLESGIAATAGDGRASVSITVCRTRWRTSSERRRRWPGRTCMR